MCCDDRFAELASSLGGGMVGVQQAGPDAALRTVEDELGETIRVTQFDGVDDVARIEAAFAAHAGRCIHFPKRNTAYQITALVEIPANTTLIFEQGAHCELAYDGPAFQLGDGSFIWHLRLDGQGATYPNGKGVIVDENDRNNGLFDAAILNTGGYCIDFLTKLAGSNFISTNASLSRSGTTTVCRSKVVINLAEDGLQIEAVPRTFLGLRTNGWPTIYTGSCNNLFIAGGGYCGPFHFSDNSRGIMISGVRWGNQPTCEIKGANITISGCDIAPALTITQGDGNGSGQSITIEANSMNNPRVIDASGWSHSNLIQHRIVACPLNLFADDTPVTIAAANNRTGVYRAGSDYCLDVDMQGSWQGGVAAPSGLGFASAIEIKIPEDYMPTYEQFVGPINMTYNGQNRAVFGRLFGTTTGAGDRLRLGYFDGSGAFVNYTAASLSAGPVTRLRGTFRWTL